jgi:PAS domain S-box-containing protein
MTLAHRKRPRTQSELADENRMLRERLEEAEQTIAAIRNGEVDAVVVTGPNGDQVFTLAGSDHVYRVIVENMQEAALNLSLDGTILFCNRRFCEMVGTPMERVVGRRLTEYVPVDRRAGAFEVIRQACLGPVRTRLLLQAPEGEAVPVQLTGNRIDPGNGPSLCMIATDLSEIEASAGRIQQLSARQSALEQSEQALRAAKAELEDRVLVRTAELAETVEELRSAYAQLDARARQLRALAGELTMAEQRERKRLAKVLHDGLQQHLAAAKLQLGGLNLPGSEGVTESVDQLLTEAIRMSRSLSAELSPPVLHVNGLSAGLEWLQRSMRERHDFHVDLDLEGNPDLPEDVRVLLFESVRELMFNAAKHAGVSRARVGLRAPGAGGDLAITISDEGAGFDPGSVTAAADGGGFGLFSIRERTELIGGRFEVASAPGRGSCFTIRLPHCAITPPCAPEPVEELETVAAGAIRVLLADDHNLVRDGIARLVKREPGLEIVGEARDGREAVELARALAPDVVLMDISMPNLNGIDATRIIHQERPSIRVIGLSMYDDPMPVQAMRSAGAVDFKNKGCAAADLIAAIRNVMAGAAPTRHGVGVTASLRRV